ncbi:hypothetical protein SISSUDRAFT_978294 [Sistotremastrum suecicum HHB10207 ss-3]|uniref:NTF2-domain-containing protein n=1 Tax=Sistotremastrum suecicum HHB10207 ss-3 TaxID=1314776 RepID=A0A166IAS3_9AGAM|nr:hypothetical protein SISSUDRAFT_978294 [Sistotremastrum suecicum HHB10207 ss-3]
MASSTPAASSAHSTVHANVVPSEVGWQFVPQYYTYVNKQPDRLHCFYTKISTFIHGVEGEDVKPCYGQHEIHNKILSIGFQDCKVFIHSVDAQSSANNGIIIQVIGEMSNNGEPWRKFAQTFFLAEQPHGYFVLNDIFRFLKEESVDSDDVEGEAVAESEAPASPVHATEPAPAAVKEEPPVAETKAAVVEPPTVNGYHAEPKAVEPEPAATVEEEAPEAEAVAPEPTPVEESVPAPVAAESAPEPAPSPAPVAPVATPPPAAAPAAVPQTPAAAPAQPPAPPAPKTWANLAAANPHRWGNAVAQEAKGASAAPVSPAASGATTPALREPTGAAVTGAPARGPGPGTPRPNERSERDGQSAYNAAISVTTPQCFVKGVTEVISHQALTTVLTNRFGPLKELEIVRSKACAFFEFMSVESARKAIVASLSVNQGGEGGIRIDAGDGGQVRINVETRKERGDRPPPRPRGGAPPNGELRGAFRGGRGGGRGGRGGAGAGGGVAPGSSAK